MNGWQHVEMCRTCGCFAAACGHKNPYPRWCLYNDRRDLIAMMEQFYEGGPWYGTTPYGRTGAIELAQVCGELCMDMLETGTETT